MAKFYSRETAQARDCAIKLVNYNRTLSQ